MRRSEAIRILDPTTAKEALEDYKNFHGLSGKKAKLLALCIANETALAALREAEGLPELPSSNCRDIAPASLCMNCIRPLAECDWLITYKGQPGMVVYYKPTAGVHGVTGVVQQCPLYQGGGETNE